MQRSANVELGANVRIFFLAARGDRPATESAPPHGRFTSVVFTVKIEIPMKHDGKGLPAVLPLIATA